MFLTIFVIFTISFHLLLRGLFWNETMISTVRSVAFSGQQCSPPVAVISTVKQMHLTVFCKILWSLLSLFQLISMWEIQYKLPCLPPHLMHICTNLLYFLSNVYSLCQRERQPAYSNVASCTTFDQETVIWLHFNYVLLFLSFIVCTTFINHFPGHSCCHLQSTYFKRN